VTRILDWRKGGPVAALAAMLATALLPHPASAVPVSPRVLMETRGTAEEAPIAARMARYRLAQASGQIDRAPSQFALDLAKFPRDGVAHRNILVILVDFPADSYGPALVHSSASTPAYYNRLLFSDDPNDNFISLREFYRINSKGRLNVSGRVTPKWLKMPHSAAYYVDGLSGLYGPYPQNAQRLVEDAMSAAYQELGDLSFFDDDGPDGIPGSGDDDGYIDAVMVIHAGIGAEVAPTAQAQDNTLWSHESGIATYSNCPIGSSGPGCLPGLILGNERGFIYVLAAEYNDYPGDGSCGTYFHEFGHTLGLVDLYDASGPAGLGFFSLMGLGNYMPFDPNCDARVNHSCPALGSRPGNFDAWSRQFLGFDTPDVPTQPGTYTLPPVTRGGGSIKLWKNGQPGTEYFLVENRLQEGSDYYLPGDGLVLYHVDDTQVDNTAGAATYRVRVVAADGRDDLETNGATSNFGDAADFFPGTGGVTSVTDATVPSTRDYANQDTGLRLNNIAVTTAGPTPQGSFDLTLSTAPDLRFVDWTADDGGGNGYPDNGETIQLTVRVRNVGTPSNTTNYTLSTADAGITVTQPAASGPGLASYAVGTLTSAFTFQVGTYATLPHNVLFTLAWSDGSASGSMTFTVAVGMGAGLSEGFESGLGAWTAGPVPPNSIDEWHASDSRAHGGTMSAKCGSSLPLGSGTTDAQTYAQLEDAALTSPMFDLAPNSQLTFYSYIDAETYGGTTAEDGGRVEIAGADGIWKTLAVDGGYGYQIDTHSYASLRGSDAFSGSPQRWRKVVTDLSAYQGPVRIRFRFSTDDDYFAPKVGSSLVRVYEGWYVDDVSVGPRVDPGPIADRVTLRAGPSPYHLGAPSAGSIHIRFSARDGLARPGVAAKVRVFDLKGRLVRTLSATPDPLIPSQFESAWNAHDGDGRKVAAGIYFLQSDIQGQTESSRVVVLK
jgi:immune inhibitor A